MSLFDDVGQVVAAFGAEIARAGSEQDLRATQASSLRRVNELLKRLPELGKDERKAFGVAANAAKRDIEEQTRRRLAALAELERHRDLQRLVDVTLPGRAPAPGHLHILTQVTRELVDIFAELGF